MIALFLVYRCLTSASATWIYHHGYCYTIPRSSAQFFIMSEKCVSRGGSLLEIDTLEEMDVVRSFILESGTVGQEFWVGLDGFDEAGSPTPTYRWKSTGEVMNQNFWGPGEPNTKTVVCVRLKVSDVLADYYLHDWNCDRIKRGICEKTPTFNSSLLRPMTSEDDVTVSRHTEYARTQPPVTWPLCHGQLTSRDTIFQCARWCSSDVTCVGFEFYDVTKCQMVTLGSPCPMTSYTVMSGGSGYYHNVDVDVEDFMAC